MRLSTVLYSMYVEYALAKGITVELYTVLEDKDYSVITQYKDSLVLKDKKSDISLAPK